MVNNILSNISLFVFVFTVLTMLRLAFKFVSSLISYKSLKLEKLFKNKIIQKNRKITIEEMIEFIIDNYPNILNDSLNEINDADSDEDIKLKFSKIIHKKLMS